MLLQYPKKKKQQSHHPESIFLPHNTLNQINLLGVRKTILFLVLSRYLQCVKNHFFLLPLQSLYRRTSRKSIGSGWETGFSVPAYQEDILKVKAHSGTGFFVSTHGWRQDNPCLLYTSFEEVSPNTQRTASLILLFPLPFGPTTAVTPWWKSSFVLSGNDLKPCISKDFNSNPTHPLL